MKNANKLLQAVLGIEALLCVIGILNGKDMTIPYICFFVLVFMKQIADILT